MQRNWRQKNWREIDWHELRNNYFRLFININRKRGLPKTPANPRWRNYAISKYPSDIMNYHRIIWQTRPELIVETGTKTGGSALFFADQLRLFGEGRVVTVDTENERRNYKLPQRKRITYLSGDSLDKDILTQIKGMAAGKRVMVSLDDDHRAEHVTEELFAYKDIVTAGQYMVVEDSQYNGHPIEGDHGPGPYEAVDVFLSHHGDEFERVPWEDTLVLTQNVGGWLLKKEKAE